MYCNKCGAEIDDEAIICPKCGCAVECNYSYPKYKKNKNAKSKMGFGILMSLLIGLLGLIIGLCVYPDNTYERETFLKGWGLGLGIAFVIGFIAYFILFATLS